MESLEDLQPLFCQDEEFVAMHIGKSLFGAKRGKLPLHLHYICTICSVHRERVSRQGPDLLSEHKSYLLRAVKGSISWLRA